MAKKKKKKTDYKTVILLTLIILLALAVFAFVYYHKAELSKYLNNLRQIKTEQACQHDFSEIKLEITKGEKIDLLNAGGKLAHKWLDYHKNCKSCPRKWIQDYKINETVLVNKKDKMIKIDFDVKVDTEEAKVYWSAGNGKIEDNGWIKNDIIFIKVYHKDNIYRIKGLGTSPYKKAA